MSLRRADDPGRAGPTLAPKWPLLEHAGFDLDDRRRQNACDRMGPGWRDVVLPRLAQVAEEPAHDTAQGVAAPR